MGTVSWIRGGGPLVGYAGGYRSELERCGFSPWTVHRYVGVMGQLNRWLVANGVPLESAAARAGEFFAARRAAGQRRVPTMRMLDPLFGYLRGRQVLPPEQPAAVTPAEELLASYCRYLVRDRGVAPSTARRYEQMARRFLAGRMSQAGGQTGAEDLSSAEVTGYLVGCCSRLATTGSAKREAADLRSLLRFFFLRGITATDLGTAMPPVASWRDTRLPATMSAADVAALLGACDRSRPSGLRDLAILTLLARLGLRSGEVAALQLGDIDWRAGEIVVRGKGGRNERLPLTVEPGQAIAGYLRDGRPRSQCPGVILSCYAPYRGIGPRAVSAVVYRACRRAGLPPAGGHRLRHALASEMLRQGGGLAEIGQVLRHRNMGTTAVYAKVDRAALRAVARPWPEAGS
ncbi:MAG TPA: site-specific integrase [Streptosporangiaceae bacterium]|jgi:site-specific recombinase XerD|nr:site-specific integrase [Streptosporangiaceae bacterium]